MHFLVSCKNEVVPIKMKALEWSQHFSHCKSMGIFSEAQGQLTLQSLVGSGRISKSFLPANMKMIQSKMKEQSMVGSGQISKSSKI